MPDHHTHGVGFRFEDLKTMFKVTALLSPLCSLVSAV
jgi:hypothetical protein